MFENFKKCDKLLKAQQNVQATTDALSAAGRNNDLYYIGS